MKIKKKLFNKIIFGELIKFCIVGALGVSANYLIFFILYHFLHVYYLVSSALGFIIPALMSFFLNKKFTFKINDNHGLKTRILKYYLSAIISASLGLLLLRFSVEVLHINVYISNIFAIGLSTIVNFTGNKFFVFKDSKNEEKNIPPFDSSPSL
jgi:putative flippase GtrA